MSYYKVLKYLDDNKQEADDNKFTIRERGGNLSFTKWDYPIPQPTFEELDLLDDSDERQKNNFRRLRSQMKIVELTEQQRLRFGNNIPNSSLWLNSTSNRINYKDDSGNIYELTGNLLS